MRPCPFCGSENIHTEANNNDKRGFAVCFDCDAQGPSFRIDPDWSQQEYDASFKKAEEYWDGKLLRSNKNSDELDSI